MMRPMQDHIVLRYQQLLLLLTMDQSLALMIHFGLFYT